MCYGCLRGIEKEEVREAESAGVNTLTSVGKQGVLQKVTSRVS